MTERAMRVVATAGHVDHGKSSLVLALTGTDPDRWHEEKERGLTIDLGFAFTRLPSGAEVGFVDVPGHVRFLKNMLAGVGAVRAAVLVVAATEGWMPQTEEHLRILELLGVDRGFTVLSKADLVDAETLELAHLEAAEACEATFLADAPMVACDTVSGRGVDLVRDTLDAVVSAIPGHGEGAGTGEDAGADTRPRLWVDRVFSARGAGTVVTGTLTGGSISADDEVVLAPGDHRARVRGIQSGHEPVTRALAGTRVALNLSGVDRARLARGHAVVVDGEWAHTDTVDVELTLLAGHSLPRRARLKAYVGSGEYDAALRRLDDRFARLHLPVALPLAPDDRLVLRDPGPGLTVGGATVVDVAPTLPARRAAAVLAKPPGPRLLATHRAVTLDDLPRLTGLPVAACRALADELVAGGAGRWAGDALLSAEAASAAVEQVAAAVDELHARSPLEPGLDLNTAAAPTGLRPEVVRHLLDSEDDFVVEQGRVRRADHLVDVMDDPSARRYVEALDAQPWAPPAPEELDTPPEVVRALERTGLVVEVDGVRFGAAALAEALRLVAGAVVERGSLTVSDARDLFGSSRKYVLPILAAADGRGITRRKGDERVPGPRAEAPG